MSSEVIVRIPWDSDALGFNAYDVTVVNESTLVRVRSKPGHYTARANPITSKRTLEEAGFYYVDTLIEPFCNSSEFRGMDDSAITISNDTGLAEILDICSGAFEHDRFHRDFNVKHEAAERRYSQWIKQLYAEKRILCPMYADTVAAFVATIENKLVLHAVAREFRGKGYARRLWTPICRGLFKRGYAEITSSVSASNLAVLNLYASMGFRFRAATDIYHCLVK